MSEVPSTPSATPDQDVNLSSEPDIAYWCEIFGVDPTQLRVAVQATGPRAVDVGRYLKLKGQGGDRA